MKKLNFNFLVVGSGLAGLYAALYAANFGKIAIITKLSFNTSNTYWAQGGVAVAVSKSDSPKNHFYDTINAGDGLCHKDAVRILVEEGKERINELINLGMKFDKIDGKIALGLEGAHTKRRVLHAGGDSTGRKLIEFLEKLVLKNSNIKLFEFTNVFEILVHNQTCYGFYAYNFNNKETYFFRGETTLIATGGASGIYKRTTNPHSTTGDGIWLAYNAGAEIANMEFIQFHPSALVLKTNDTFLISEAVRGEGAYLVNDTYERFMLSKHEKGELAPRDIVAFEIYKQINYEKSNVYLTLKHLDSEKIKTRFNHIYKEVKKFGYDITKDLIPIAPAAHYLIGGIKSGLSGETKIQGLYSAGEAACTGVHGANRLASNSLLECLVFSRRAIDYSLNVKNINQYNLKVVDKELFEDERNLVNYNKFRIEISNLIMEKVGILRNETDLKKAIIRLEQIEQTFNFIENECYSMRAEGLLTVCKLITEAALYRKESRGGHRREDFPSKKSKYVADTIQHRDKKNKYVPIKNLLFYE